MVPMEHLGATKPGSEKALSPFVCDETETIDCLFERGGFLQLPHLGSLYANLPCGHYRTLERFCPTVTRSGTFCDARQQRPFWLRLRPGGIPTGAVRCTLPQRSSGQDELELAVS